MSEIKLSDHTFECKDGTKCRYRLCQDLAEYKVHGGGPSAKFCEGHAKYIVKCKESRNEQA